MKRNLLKWTLFIVVALAVLLTVYIWSFRSTYVVLRDPPSKSYAISVFGIRFPFTPSTKDAFNRIYAPLRRWHADHLPQRLVQGTLHWVQWDSQEVAIRITDENSLIGCQFDEQLATPLRRLAIGDAVRARIGFIPGESPVVYDYKLISISQ